MSKGFGLENRLRDLALYYGKPVQEVVKMYEHRYNILTQTRGKEFRGRESHISWYAYKGTEGSLKLQGDKD